MLLNMSTKELFLGFIFLVLSVCAVDAQRITDRPQILTNLSHNDGAGGRIEIIQPEQCEDLLKMKIANNYLQKGIPGFRILIFSASGQTARARSIETRQAFMKRYPEMNAYQEYNTPNFQIYVGDFRTKNDALRELKRIERVYPRAYIVAATIQI